MGLGAALVAALLGLVATYYPRLTARTAPAPALATQPKVAPPGTPLAQARNGAWICLVDRIQALPRDRMRLHGWLRKDGESPPRLPACRITVRDERGTRLDASDSRRVHTEYGEMFEAVFPRSRGAFTVEATFVPGEPREDAVLGGFVAVIVPMRVVGTNGRVDVLVRANEAAPAPKQHTAELEIIATAGERAPIPWLVSAQGTPLPSRSLDEIDAQPLNVARYQCDWSDADTPVTLKLLSERSAREQEIRIALRGLRSPRAEKVRQP